MNKSLFWYKWALANNFDMDTIANKLAELSDEIAQLQTTVKELRRQLESTYADMDRYSDARAGYAG